MLGLWCRGEMPTGRISSRLCSLWSTGASRGKGVRGGLRHLLLHEAVARLVRLLDLCLLHVHLVVVQSVHGVYLGIDLCLAEVGGSLRLCVGARYAWRVVAGGGQWRPRIGAIRHRRAHCVGAGDIGGRWLASLWLALWAGTARERRQRCYGHVVEVTPLREAWLHGLAGWGVAILLRDHAELLPVSQEGLGHVRVPKEVFALVAKGLQNALHVLVVLRLRLQTCDHAVQALDLLCG
mmetsp:Transcript_94234/g.130889  ORF Transcript_94234/g.130889 Transcript_94234/m.130889 type:complete len:237 (-) Transcript_94234:263-973(-)